MCTWSRSASRLRGQGRRKHGGGSQRLIFVIEAQHEAVPVDFELGGNSGEAAVAPPRGFAWSPIFVMERFAGVARIVWFNIQALLDMRAIVFPLAGFSES